MNLHLKTAYLALDKSRQIIKRYFRQSLKVESKSDASPVTIADQSAESAIREVILKRHHDHGILGEEMGENKSSADYQWVIDPIDGTKSFISGMPIFGTLLGLTHRDKPIMGIIDMPILNERWVGEEGEATLYNETPCNVSTVDNLHEAKLFCTGPDMFTTEQLKYFDALVDHVTLRRFGGDCYGYGLLASGHIDLVVEGDLKFYDVLALIPVVEGAGGIITDWRGDPLTKDLDGLVIAAATRELHREAIAILSGALDNEAS